MSVKQYRKKPVVIEAVQYTGENAEDIFKWMRANDTGEAAYEDLEDDDGIVIITIEGAMLARPGWFIIRGVAGEFYPCEPEIFALTYEEVNK